MRVTIALAALAMTGAAHGSGKADARRYLSDHEYRQERQIASFRELTAASMSGLLRKAGSQEGFDAISKLVLCHGGRFTLKDDGASPVELSCVKDGVDRRLTLVEARSPLLKHTPFAHSEVSDGVRKWSMLLDRTLPRMPYRIPPQAFAEAAEDVRGAVIRLETRLGRMRDA